MALFGQWLQAAIDAGVPEPLAATVATVDRDGVPDARVLMLKDVGKRGWAFAGTASFRKGQQLEAAPAAAMHLWWQPVMRAVRVQGPVEQATAEECAADLAARSASARASTRPIGGCGGFVPLGSSSGRAPPTANTRASCTAGKAVRGGGMSPGETGP